MERYNDHGIGFAPTFPAFTNHESSSPSTSRRLPDVSKNYSETMVYDSHGYIYNSMSGGGSTIATEEIEFQYPEDTADHSVSSAYNPAAYKVDRPEKLLTTNSSMTASTWLNETTLASTSLLDQDDGESTWSSASLTTSVLLDNDDDDDDADTIRTTNYDDATTYMESPLHQAPIDLVESFLDDLAENESIQRLGNFFLSSACRGRYSSDDDDNDDEEEYSMEERTEAKSRRGRSPPSRRKAVSTTDSIFEERQCQNSRKQPKKRKGLKSLFACGYD